MVGLCFVTSLRHPLNSNNYARVEQLLAETVGSWDRQDRPGWSGVVVGNREPRVDLPGCVTFVKVDFPPPSNEVGPMTGIPAVLRDKGTKLAVGLAAARTTGATHVMFVDADDLVSRRVAGFVADHPRSRGWIISHGWRWSAQRRSVREHRGDFHMQCGTSHIVRTDLYPAPELSANPTQRELYAAYGNILERWLGSHMHVGADLDLPILPFAGSLYRVGSGESHSGNGMGGWGRPVTKQISLDFGVPSTGWSPLRLARATLPSPQAAAHRIRRAVSLWKPQA